MTVETAGVEAGSPTHSLNDAPLRIEPNPRQVEFLRSTADIAVYGGQVFSGKGSTLDSTVWTPFGPRRMGDLEPGDTLCRPAGGMQRVVATYPLGTRDVYCVTCADGAQTTVTGDHLWKYRLATKDDWRKSGVRWKLATTETLADLLDAGRHVLLPLAAPATLTLPHRSTVRPIDPYTLGLLIGDGCFRGSIPTLTQREEPVLAGVAEELGGTISRPRDRAPVLVMDTHARAALGELGLWGLLSADKHVPDSYRLAPVADRWALLQGLMDADGTVGANGCAEFTTVSQRLAHDVQFLVRSLGGTATLRQRAGAYTTDTGERVECQDAYTLAVFVPDRRELFRLDRKRGRCAPSKRDGRRVVSIEPAGKAEAQCIRVDDCDGLYLTDDFITTHNTFSLLMEPLYDTHNPRFTATIFRRTYKQVMLQGGLWDSATELYAPLNATPRRGDYTYVFPSGARVQFAYLDTEADLLNWQGPQIDMIGWDQMEQFTERQIFYLLSRSRSMSGAHSRVRGTCNPDPDCFLRSFLSWWIDDDTGFAIYSRSGVKRWFVREHGEFIWGDSESEVLSQCSPGQKPLSVTFIPARTTDNEIGIAANPRYIAFLQNLPYVDRRRLLEGDWNIRPSAGLIFKSEWFRVVRAAPITVDDIRYWDRAATASDAKNADTASWTAGVLMSRSTTGEYYVKDVVRFQGTPRQVRERILNVASQDGKGVRIGIEEDPGQAGKAEAQSLVSLCAGFEVTLNRVREDKARRAAPLSSQAEAGNVHLVEGAWNDAFLRELENFDGSKTCVADQVDAASGAFHCLTTVKYAGLW